MIFFWYEESSSAFRWGLLAPILIVGYVGGMHLDRSEHCVCLADYSYNH
jgi:hypothetical protein